MDGEIKDTDLIGKPQKEDLKQKNNELASEIKKTKQDID